jgi:hypothetical protein
MEFRQPYPTDLNDTEWQILKPFTPAAKPAADQEIPKREDGRAHLWVISDGPASIRCAIAKGLPNVPPQLCHFHYLHQAASRSMRPIATPRRN